MKTATVRELRNHCTTLLESVKSGEEVVITERGIPVARLVPEKPAERGKVDWSTSHAVTRDRSGEKMLTAEESVSVVREASGRW